MEVPGSLNAIEKIDFERFAFSPGIYLENFNTYDMIFGSLGAVVTFLLLVFVSANVMLLGAEVAAESPRVPRGYSAHSTAMNKDHRSLWKRASQQSRALAALCGRIRKAATHTRRSRKLF